MPEKYYNVLFKANISYSTVRGVAQVRADSPEEALKKAQERADDCDDAFDDVNWELDDGDLPEEFEPVHVLDSFMRPTKEELMSMRQKAQVEGPG
jgi:hypothetical protein